MSDPDPKAQLGNNILILKPKYRMKNFTIKIFLLVIKNNYWNPLSQDSQGIKPNTVEY